MPSRQKSSGEGQSIEGVGDQRSGCHPEEVTDLGSAETDLKQRTM